MEMDFKFYFVFSNPMICEIPNRQEVSPVIVIFDPAVCDSDRLSALPGNSILGEHSMMGRINRAERSRSDPVYSAAHVPERRLSTYKTPVVMTAMRIVLRIRYLRLQKRKINDRKSPAKDIMI